MNEIKEVSNRTTSFKHIILFDSFFSFFVCVTEMKYFVVAKREKKKNDETKKVHDHRFYFFEIHFGLVEK